MPGPLRIVRQPVALGDDTKGAAAAKVVEDYGKRLVNMAPAEVTGLYLTLRPLIVGDLKSEQITAASLAAWWPWICAALVIFIRLWATHGDDKLAITSWMNAQVTAVGIATAAFVFWVWTMGHPIAFLSDGDPQAQKIGAFFAGIFTFVVPIFYKGDPPRAPMQSPDGR